MDIEKAKDDLLNEMKVTKGSRFNASKRLEQRDRRMIKITAFASVYVIILTLLPLFFHVGETFISVVNVTTIIFSLAILAASLLQYSNNDPVRAEQHHRCALEVNALRRELRAITPCTNQMLSDFGRRYDEILQKYSVNHDEIDFEKYKLEHPDEYPPDLLGLKNDSAEKRIYLEQHWVDWAVRVMTVGVITIAASIGFERAIDVVKQIIHILGK